MQQGMQPGCSACAPFNCMQQGVQLMVQRLRSTQGFQASTKGAMPQHEWRVVCSELEPSTAVYGKEAGCVPCAMQQLNAIRMFDQQASARLARQERERKQAATLGCGSPGGQLADGQQKSRCQQQIRLLRSAGDFTGALDCQRVIVLTRLALLEKPVPRPSWLHQCQKGCNVTTPAPHNRARPLGLDTAACKLIRAYDAGSMPPQAW